MSITSPYKNGNEKKENLIEEICNKFPKSLLAVRSSTKAEDTEDSSMAGAFESILNIESKSEEILDAVERVINSFDEDDTNQVLIQPMVKGCFYERCCNDKCFG